MVWVALIWVCRPLMVVTSGSPKSSTFRVAANAVTIVRKLSAVMIPVRILDSPLNDDTEILVNKCGATTC